MHFYRLNERSYLFEEDSKTQSIFVAEVPLAIEWEDRVICIAHRKNYVILSYPSGKMLNKLNIEPGPVPGICTMKGMTVVLGSNNLGYYVDDNGTVKKNLQIDFEQSTIVRLGVQSIYLIALCEYSVQIYNAATGEFLQERGVLDKT